MFFSNPACRACFFTICQMRTVVNLVPRSERKISLPLRRLTSFGRSVERYAASASHALRPTGTRRVLFPLPAKNRKKIFNATTINLIDEAESPERFRSARYSLMSGRDTARGLSIFFFARHHCANSLNDLWVES